MKSINPTSNKVIQEYKEYSLDEINESINLLDSKFYEWKKVNWNERKRLFSKLADLLEEQKNNLAELMMKEMGKPLAEGVSEIEKCAWVCHYYIENAEKILAPDIVETDYERSEIHFEPLGTILAVMPWNYPFWQVFRFAVPTLMAGNVALLKHSSNVSGCALEIEKLFLKAGFEPNTFKTILVKSDKLEKILSHEKIKAVTLTGSTEAGRSVAALAGKYLKKSVLELGGSDPYIILKDADLDEAAKLCAKSRLLNGGQSCISAKRFIVESEVHDQFVEKLIEQFKSKKVGDPSEEGTDIGPLAREDLREELNNQVEKTLSAGAKCVFQGEVPEETGAFYPLTILTHIQKSMPAYSEELFGPVASVIKVSSLEEAVKVANDSSFGLGAAIFSKNKNSAFDIAAKQIDSGAVFVNDFVKSDPRLPFGGVKDSGFGRELSEFGIKEFVNIKTVCLK
tara:strand:- start:4172 stop:5533 length:1362 start_codon:yes stop_codon:yes gene_type:complete